MAASLVTEALSVGDRVVLVDPPHARLYGEVSEITEHAVSVRWDHIPAAGSPGLIGRDGLHRLHREGSEPRWNDPR